MRAAAVVCGAVLALAVAPLAFGHGTTPDRNGFGPWAGEGRQDYVEEGTGIATPTTVGILHYSKKGIHVVPGRPKS
jgi:Bacterial toxin 50